ncbi:MAG: four helix bundle protein [Ferruginibacter sp.]
MPTVTKFEDLEIWQLARQQASDIYTLYNLEPFCKDYELKKQINAASGR